MCIEATVDGKDYNTVAKLRAVMPNGLVRCSHYQPEPELVEDACLCQLDLEATARLNGYEAERDEAGFFMEFSRADGRSKPLGP